MTGLFNEINLDQSLVKALEKQNISTPTEVQSRVIPLILQNKDLIVQSETGTGKTLAYLLPLFQKIDVSKKDMQVIILTPTHELAIQILRQIELLAENSDFKVKGTSIIGNVNIARQIDKLKEKPHIIVGSPGRILELIKKRKITAHTVKTIVLDEADRLLDESNSENVMAVIKSTLRDRQLMTFSATMSQKSVARAKEIMKEPEVIRSESKTAVPTSIEHLYFVGEQREKINVLRRLVRIINPKKALVFVNGSYEIDVFTTKIKYHGLKAEAIHGTNKKLDRKRVMEEFRTGKIQLLIASDIAARGLDVEGVTHVFNLSLPEDPMDYLHRVGRTGRAGNAGVAVSIVTEREIPLLKKYENSLKISILQKDTYKDSIVDVKRR